MSGLLGLFHLGAGAFIAQSSGAAVAGRNIANANTEGYSREVIDFDAERGAPLVGGVSTKNPRRLEDQIFAKRERLGFGLKGRADNLANAMFDFETTLVPQSQNLAQSIGSFFTTVAQLAAAPTDEAMRKAALGGADDIARFFREAATTAAQARSDANGRIGVLAQEANKLMEEIAAANRSLATDPDPVLEDRRELAAKKLSEITGGQARIDKDGKLRFVVGGGEVLVDGDRAAQLRVVADPALNGLFRVEAVDGAHVANITGILTSGKLGGELEFRDVISQQTSADLDQLAFDFISRINTIQTSNLDLNGNPGIDLFTQPGAAAGAALNMRLNPAVAGNARLLAGAAVGQPAGDNTGFLELLALRDQAAAAGNTRSFGEEAIRVFASVGEAARVAFTQRDLELDRADALANFRDGIAGVSIEDELTRMTAFQRAAEASTKFIRTVDDLLSTFISQI